MSVVRKTTKAEVIDDGTDQAEPVLDVSPELVDKYMFRLPQAYAYGDYIWPGLLMTADRLEKVNNFEFRATDVLICSYPKSGTTWISEIVSLLVHHGDVDEVKRSPLHERVPWLELDESFAWVRFFLFWQMISRMVGLGAGENVEEDVDDGKRRVFFTHLPLELLPRSALESRCKIVYVARNPKDNAVSFFHFHQMARFLGLQKTTWSEFFPLYTVGKIYCGSWFEHVQGFWKYSQVSSNVLFLKYEDMKADLRGEVARTADFLGLQLTDEVIERVARHSTFGAMKENKMANRQGVWLFDQTVSKFMRKGEVGDWRNYFTLAQSELFDRVYESRMRSTPELHFDFGDESDESKRAIKARNSIKPPKHVDEGLPPSPSSLNK